MFFVLFWSGKDCLSASNYLGGSFINMTSTPAGLMLKLDSGLPTNCTGTPYDWMLIRAENKTMIALLLTMYTSGKKGAVVYTSGIMSSGFCEINQYDPVE